MLSNKQRALVLGGGGFAASSWITGAHRRDGRGGCRRAGCRCAEEGVAEPRASGTEVDVTQPDDEAMEVIATAGSPMNPAVFEPATRAGRAQGLRVVAQRGTTWW